MPKILNPKEVAGTTRFILDFELTPTMIIQLLKEFKEEYPDVQSTFNSLKFINKQEKKAIEISDEFISIFPQLTETETESIRKRIYKHIAKRSEVYFSTSKENLKLSLSSLLTDDLRSCASLLYYALHKYINGEMYNYFNTKLNLAEHEIDFKEVEHFTSANFSTFVQKVKKSNKELTKKNYLETLCICKPKCFDPFILSKFIISTEKLNKSYLNFQPYLEFICSNQFEKNYYDVDLSTFLKKEVELFYKKKSKKEATQEDEVKAAIAYSIQKSIEVEEEKCLWMFYVLTLRLYWLRQTADYEFDFEVKTSVREMSILVSAMKLFLESLEDVEEDELVQEGDIQEKQNLENDAFPIRKKEDLEYVIEEESKGVIYYSVDAKFPSEINYPEEDIYIFMTAVHLDSIFKKDDVIRALNLTENVTNKGKYFIYETKGTILISLYIHINDDGRWTAWISNDDIQVHVMSPFEMVEIFNSFIRSFNRSFDEYFNNNFDFLLVASQPLYLESNEEINTQSLILIDKAVSSRKNRLQFRLMRSLSNYGKIFHKNNAIKINDLIFQFNWIFNSYDTNSFIPFLDMFYTKVIEEEESFVNINIVITNKSQDDLDDIINTSESIIYDLIKEHNFKDTIEASHNIRLSPEQLDEVLRGTDNDYFIGKFSECINSVAYDRIMSGTVQGTEKLIETCLSISTSGAFPHATMGMWYFRNESIEILDSESKGKDCYQKAIDMEAENKDTYLVDLQQKFYYELSRFYFYRKTDLTQAEAYIKLAMEMGENAAFYEDVLELLNEFPKTEIFDHSASTLEVGSKSESEISSQKIIDKGEGEETESNDGNTQH